MWFRTNTRKKIRVRKRRVSRTSVHYQAHKELARSIVHERLEYWNQFYNFRYKRVSIRNQKTCWGSCSEHGNLNFNYKIIFLPEALMNYVIVHELCHLKELNHSSQFWMHVSETLPEYKTHKQHLRKMTHIPTHGFPSSVVNTKILSKNTLE